MKIAQGSRVRYSRKFLQAISAFTGPLPFARGTVTEVSGTPEFALASIEWDNPEDLPARVNVKNLVLESRAHLEAV